MPKELAPGETYRVTGNYLYPAIESARTHTDRSQAEAEARDWKLEAASQGLCMRTRIVIEKAPEDQETSESE